MQQGSLIDRWTLTNTSTHTWPHFSYDFCN